MDTSIYLFTYKTKNKLISDEQFLGSAHEEGMLYSVLTFSVIIFWKKLFSTPLFVENDVVVLVERLVKEVP